MTAYKGRGFVTDRTDTRTWGRWVESAVGAHLLRMADELDYKVYYWRETGGLPELRGGGNHLVMYTKIKVAEVSAMFVSYLNLVN